MKTLIIAEIGVNHECSLKKAKKLDASSRANLVTSIRINISVKISNIKFIANILVILGLIGTGGHLFLIKALTLGEASLVAPFGYTSLLFAKIWGIMFFNN